MATTTLGAAAPLEGDFRRVPGLEGLSGRLRVEVMGKGSVVLEVKDGQARFLPADGDAVATAIVDSEETLRALQRGRLNPVVAALQGPPGARGRPGLRHQDDPRAAGRATRSPT